MTQSYELYYEESQTLPTLSENFWELQTVRIASNPPPEKLALQWHSLMLIRELGFQLKDEVLDQLGSALRAVRGRLAWAVQQSVTDEHLTEVTTPYSMQKKGEDFDSGKHYPDQLVTFVKQLLAVQGQSARLEVHYE